MSSGFEVNERVTVDYGPLKVRWHYTEPFQAMVEEVMEGGVYKVRRCSIPRRTSIVPQAQTDTVNGNTCVWGQGIELPSNVCQRS